MRSRRFWDALRAALKTLDGALIALAIGFGLAPPPIPNRDMPREPEEEEPADAGMSWWRSQAYRGCRGQVDPPAPLSATERRDWADLLNRLG